jgi:hypothetical protein
MSLAKCRVYIVQISVVMMNVVAPFLGVYLVSNKLFCLFSSFHPNCQFLALNETTILSERKKNRERTVCGQSWNLRKQKKSQQNFKNLRKKKQLLKMLWLRIKSFRCDDRHKKVETIFFVAANICRCSFQRVKVKVVLFRSKEISA